MHIMAQNDISDDRLLALGRFTWAAMKLETWTGRICRYMVEDVTEKGTVGQWVPKIKKQLPDPDTTQARAIAWLDKAYGVLDENRNAILHGQLAAFYFGDSPAPESPFEWELRIANVRHKSLVPFTVDAIAERQAEIEAVHHEGITIDVDLASRGSTVRFRDSLDGPSKDLPMSDLKQSEQDGI
jgi:hypothetical protein